MLYKSFYLIIKQIELFARVLPWKFISFSLSESGKIAKFSVKMHRSGALIVEVVSWQGGKLSSQRTQNLKKRMPHARYRAGEQ